ncbi:MAG TPA: hypothetical protein VKN99_06685 [Polyangia bacterium]|nr:hypothetical protein [Polyangia bacterium]
MRLWLPLFLCAQAAPVALAQPAPEKGPPMAPQARQHLERGLRYYNAQDYAKAVDEFKAGYQIDPRPEFLYALAQAQRLSGDCEKAISSYQAFLRTHPNDLQASSARQNIERCEAERATKTTKAPPPLPPPNREVAKTTPAPRPPPAPPPAALTHTAPPARDPWYRDTLGDVLTGAGVVALVVGGLLWKSGHDDIEDANAIASATPPMPYDKFASIADGAETRQTVGGVLFLTGAALSVGGIVRYVLRPGGPSEPAISAAPVPGGSLFSLRARF